MVDDSHELTLYVKSKAAVTMFYRQTPTGEVTGGCVIVAICE